MTLFRWCISFFLALGGASLFAQSEQSKPAVITAIPAQSVLPGGQPISINLREHLGLPDVSGQVVQFDTVLGKFNVEMRAANAPLHVANFLSYVESGAYTNTFFHRTAVFSNPNNPDAPKVPAITQAGGFRLPYSTLVTQNAALALEGNLLNAEGTLAAARLNSPNNSATNQFYFNTKDNSSDLQPANQGGYSVFGRVIGSGMTIVKAIAAVPTYNRVDGSANTSAFNEIPLRNAVPGILTEANLIIIRTISVIPIYPTGTGTSVLTFTAQSSNASVAAATIDNVNLVITPGTREGIATVTVKATDTNANVAEATVTVSVAASVVAPAVVRGPVSQVVSEGGSVAFDVVTTGSPLLYQWKRNNEDIVGANGPVLVLKSVGAANEGTYTVTISNNLGSVTSSEATLTVSSASNKARVNNFSVKSQAGLGAQTLTAGFTVNNAGQANLVIRGVGPSLGLFGISNVLADPKLDLFSSDGALLTSNDNWSGDDGRAVGGFSLLAGSKDAVLSVMSLSAGGYTAQVNGVGGATGEALVELYEVPQANPKAEITNLSARTQLNSGTILTAGFSIGAGTNRTALVRAIGPGLSALNVPGTLSNPKIQLFGSGGAKLGENDDWGGDTMLVETMASVGAFGIADTASKDAMLVVSLPPGGYTAEVTGVGGSSGVVLVEVYILP